MMPLRSRLRWMLPVAILLAGFAVAQAPPPAAPAVARTLNVPDGALVAAGKAPEIDMLYTGDVIGYIEPCG